MTALIAWPSFHHRDGTEVDKPLTFKGGFLQAQSPYALQSPAEQVQGREHFAVAVYLPPASFDGLVCMRCLHVHT